MVAIETILSSSSDMNQPHKHTLQPDHTLISTKDEKSLTKVDEIKKKNRKTHQFQRKCLAKAS